MRMFGFFGKKAKYPALSWWENFMGGHISFGYTTIFGANAMNWVMEIHTKKYGYICFTLPTIERVKKSSFYIYFSPNATPWAATFYLGKSKDEFLKAKLRKINFGHNFNTDDQATYECLRRFNDEFGGDFRFDLDPAVYRVI